MRQSLWVDMPDGLTHRDPKAKLGQVGLGLASLCGILFGVGCLAAGLWFVAALIVPACGFYCWRIGWCWSDTLEVDAAMLRWRAPLRRGSVELANVVGAQWFVVRRLIYSPVVVVKVRGGPNIVVWFDRGLPEFFAACSIPMTKVLRTW